MDAVIAYAKTVLFFLLFVNLIMQLLKGSTYERFVYPICGMILVILIIRPVLGLFDGDEKVLYAAEQKISLLLAQSDADYGEKKEQGYEFTVLEAYEEELSAQLAGILEKEGLVLLSADFSLSAEEEDFGTIRGIRVDAAKETGNAKEKIKIAPIVFDTGKTDETMSAEEIYIKDKLADFYQVEEGNIYVNIKEEQDG